jgi:hypothetical protein
MLRRGPSKPPFAALANFSSGQTSAVQTKSASKGLKLMLVFRIVN